MSDITSLAGTVVAVTGLHRGESPQPGGPVVSCLRRRAPDMRIIGLCYDPMESGLFSSGHDRLDRAFLMPYPRAGAAALLARLDVILAEERIDVIVPCLDSEIENYTELAPELNKRGIRVCLPSLQSFEDRDKTNVSEFCRRIGVPAPKTFRANDAAALARFADDARYPCYIKGRLYGARKVANVAQLYDAFTDIYGIWGGPVLLQEIVAGEEYGFTGFGDGQGRILKHCTIRKLLRTSTGKGFAGVVVEDPSIVALGERIVRELRWNGPFELEFLKAPGRPHALFEMNPRFPSWIDFPAQLGCNLPVLMVEHMLNLPETPLAECPAGRMFLRHCTDLVADIADIARIGGRGDTAERAEPPVEVTR